MKIRVSIDINASISEVWDSLKVIESHTQWMADAESIEFTTARTTGVGTSFVCVTKIGPLHTRDIMTVTVWEPRRAMGIRHEGIVRGTGRFTLKKLRNSRTRFTWKERLAFPWWMGGPVGAFVAKPILRWVWRRNLRRFKVLIEGVK